MQENPHPSFASKRYAVVGAGLMGRLTAFALARKGAQVSLFDRGGPEGEFAAAKVAAAMLAPLAESAITERNVVQMGIYSLPRWKAIIADLSLPVFLQHEGTVIVWHQQDASEAKRFGSHLERNCLQSQLTGDPSFELPHPEHLDRSALHALEPSLSDRFHQGMFLPNEGQLDNRQLLTALLHELSILQVDLRWNQAVDPDDVYEQGQYDWVIDCRGLGAKNIWTSNPLRGIRGEVLRLHAPEVHLKRPTRLIHPRYPIYIAPKENDIYVVGATEIESEDLSPTSVRSAMELLSAVYTVHSGFAEARILEMSTQCRPTLKDNLPEIRVSKPGLMLINGLYRHGFLIAPAILDCALEIMQTSAEMESSPLASRLQLHVTNLAEREPAPCAS
ncbi:MAG: FAD-dependent oxidoreductase [Polynucleobacter sp.]|nr:FAD-dependent oxidoreductase [Polynucleobacter sp.]